MSYSHYCDNLHCILPNIRRHLDDKSIRSLSATRFEATAFLTPTHTSSKTKLSLEKSRMHNLRLLARTVSEEQRKHKLEEQRSLLIQRNKSTKVQTTQAKIVKPYDQRLKEAKQRRFERTKKAFSVGERKRSIIDAVPEVKLNEDELLKSPSEMSKTFDRFDFEDYEEVDRKMHNIEAKFARSEILRKQALVETQARAAKTRVIRRDQTQADMSNVSYDSYTVAAKLIARHQEAAKRRLMLKKVPKRLSNRLNVADILQKKEQDLKHKTKLIEERLKAANIKLTMNKKVAMQDLDTRHEASRIKDYEATEKQTREDSVLRNRRMQILERHIDRTRQIEEMISRRQTQAAEARDLRIQSMIEKEKFNEIRTRVMQSPHSKLAVSILKEFA